MRVLVVTPILKPPGGRAQLYGRGIQSILDLRWDGTLEHVMQVGGDDLSDGNGSCARKYIAASELCLREGYDAMLCAESDMLVPADGLQKLAALDADIAYGLYVLRHGRRDWSAATALDRFHYESLSADVAAARAAWGQPVPVCGVGMGFTLIRRRALEAAPLHWWPGVCVDWALGCDAQTLGLTQVCDTSVVCGHFSLLPSPRLLWPDPDAPGLYRVEYL